MRTSKSKEETDGGQVPSGSKEEINESKWKLMRANKSKEETNGGQVEAKRKLMRAIGS